MMMTSLRADLLPYLALPLALVCAFIAVSSPTEAAWTATALVAGLVTAGISYSFPQYRDKLAIVAVALLVALAPFDLYNGPILLPIGHLTVPDLALGIALAMALANTLTRFANRSPWAVVSVPLLLYLAYSAVSIFVAYAQSVGIHQALYEYRPLAYYLLALAVVAAGRGKSNTYFFGWLVCAVAVLVAAKALLTAIAFPGLAAPSGTRVADVANLGNGAIRVTAGSSWTEVGFLLLFPFIARVRRARWLYLIATALLLTGVVISYTRTIWLSDAIALLAVLPLLRVHWFKGWVRLAVFAGMGVLVLVLVSPHFLTTISTAILGRLSPASVNPSLFNRHLETAPALSAFGHDPILGTGLGSTIVRYTTAGHVTLSAGFLHNGYLFVLVKQGIVGFCLFGLMMTTALWRAWRTAMMACESECRLLATGCLAALIALLITNYSAPFLTETVDGVVLAALILGIIDRLYAEHKAMVAEDAAALGQPDRRTTSDATMSAA